MIKKVVISLLFCLFILITFSEIGLTQWQDTVLQRLTENLVPDYINQLYVDSTDKLHLFYMQAKQVWPIPRDYWILYTTKENGEPWSESDTMEELEGRQFFYDVNSDIIHVVYTQKYSDTTRLYYTNSFLNWEPELADPTGKGYAGLDLKVDSLGNVHLVCNYEYPVDTTGYKFYKVRYATNASGEWVWQEVSSPIELGYGGSGKSSYLGVNRNGRAHILYPITHPRPYFWVPIYLCHTYNDSLCGTVWCTDTLDGPTYGYPSGSSIAIDGDCGIHMLTERIVGFDYDSIIVYYSYRPSIAEPWGEPELVEEYGAAWQIFIDQQKNAHILWKQRDHLIILGAIFYAAKKSGNWESEMILDNEPYWSLNCGFVIDSYGKGHLVFDGHFDSTSYIDSTVEIYYLGESSSWAGTTSVEHAVKFELSQNYPNPFNLTTTIPFTINGSLKTENSPIPTTLKIYNILGEEVITLVDQKKQKGGYGVLWNGKNNEGKEVSSGVYFYLLKAGGHKRAKKMILIK